MADNNPIDETRTQRTAFVMAGGGSLGAVEVGMLQALIEGGEKPAFLVGSSAGAINAAYFAGDPTAAGARMLEQLWCAMKRRDILPISLRSVIGLLRLCAPITALHSLAIATAMAQSRALCLERTGVLNTALS